MLGKVGRESVDAVEGDMTEGTCGGIDEGR